MKNRTIIKLILLGFSAIIFNLAVFPAHAQSDAEDTDDAKVKTSEDLVYSAGFIKKKLAELLVAMSDVAKLLEKTEPDVAVILKRTVEHAQREDVAGKIEDVIRDIRQGLDQAAQIQQGEVIDDLTQMLRILEGGVGDLTKAEKRLAELQAIRDKLDKNLQRQQLEEKQTRPAANLEDIKKQSETLIKALQGIIEKQKSLKAKTNKVGSCDPKLVKLGELLEAIEDLSAKQKILGDAVDKSGLSELPILAEAQNRLAGRAKSLSDELAEVQADPNNKEVQVAAEHIKSADAQMEKAVSDLEKSDKPSASDSEEKALADLQAAGKQLRKMLEDKSADTPAGRLAKPQNQLGKQTGQLADKEAQLAEQAGIDPKSLSDKDEKKVAGDLNLAAESMDQAAKKLSAQQPVTAEAKQEQALVELAEQLRRVTELHRRALAQAEKKLNEAEQKRIAEDLKDLAERMKEGEGKKATAGGQAVASAGNSANSAAGEMSKNDAKSANNDQKKTLEQLRKAQEELNEEIAQLERRIKAEKLASVEERLAKILEEQKACNIQTRKTYSRRNQKTSAYDRQAKQTLGELSKTEGSLAEEVQSVRNMLKKEGSTVVFPEVLREVQEDLAAVQKQLAQFEPGPLVQTTQEDIVRTLEELISAVRKELSKGHGRAMSGGGQGQGQGSGKAPLVPPVAELRMLRLQQLRVNAGTRRAQRMVESKQITQEAADAQYRKLSERQKRVTDIAKKMASKMKTQGASQPEKKVE